MFPTLPDGLQYTRDCVDSSGWGVVATRPFVAGEIIGQFEGTRMTKAAFKALYGTDTLYTYYPTQNFPNCTVIVAKDPRNFITYINEGKEPNVGLARFKLRALKEIVVGEELLLKYGKQYPRNYSLP